MGLHLLFDVPGSCTALAMLHKRLRLMYPLFHPDLLVPIIPRSIIPATDRRRLLCPAPLVAAIQGQGNLSLKTLLAREAPGIIVTELDGDQAADMLAVAASPVMDSIPAGELVGGYSRALRAVRADVAHQRRWSVLPLAAGIAIAHIDTGIDETHPCFANDRPRVESGVNFVEPGHPPRDPYPRERTYVGMPGHGVRTASVLMASDENRMKGIVPGASLFPYRITDVTIIDIPGVRTKLADALLHSMQRRDCDVVSLALDDPTQPASSVVAAVAALYEGGVIMCCASGNVSPTVVAPANLPGTIAVGGSMVPTDGPTMVHRPWDSASSGDEVDISAPADKVLRAHWHGLGDTVLPAYGIGDGTSYAASMVAGAAALWLARHGPRALKAAGLTGWKRVEAFRHCLKTSAQPWTGTVTGYGAGVLDVAALMDVPLPIAASLSRQIG